MLMPSLELGVRFLLALWIWIQTCSAAANWWLRTKWAPPVRQVSAQRSETSLRVLYPYRSWWWWALRWGERSPTLLAGGSTRHACAAAAAHRSSGGEGGGHNGSVLVEATCLADLWGGFLPAWAGCSRPGGTVWWRSAGTRLTSSGVGAWRIGRPRRKNAPSGSCRSRRPSSAGLYCTCREHTGGLTPLLKYQKGGGEPEKQ